jgi:hypothetical protein
MSPARRKGAYRESGAATIPKVESFMHPPHSLPTEQYSDMHFMQVTIICSNGQ